MEFDVNESADKLSNALDTGSENEVASLFMQELQSAGTRDNRRQLITRVDQLEKNFHNLDLIVKNDDSGTPIGYSILPKDQHESARKMATLMDEGNVYEAATFGAKVKDSFGTNRDEARNQKLAFGRWSIAVDAYEQNNKGEDVTINYFNKRSTNPRYSFAFHREQP